MPSILRAARSDIDRESHQVGSQLPIHLLPETSRPLVALLDQGQAALDPRGLQSGEAAAHEILGEALVSVVGPHGQAIDVAAPAIVTAKNR